MSVRSPRVRLYLIKAYALFVTVLSLVGLGHPAPAQNQYPGGGGSGGGYPGGGPAGWVAVPTPASANGGSPVYDWTGLNLLTDLLVPPNVPDSSIYHQSFVSPGGVNFTSYPFDSPGGGNGTGGSNGFLQSYLQVNGISTYKWQWLPPNGDLTQYPAPNLYVLGKTSGAVTSFYRTNTGQAVLGGVSISATLTDGWGWSQTLTTIPGALPTGPNLPPGRKVLNTSADGSLANTYKATLAPSLTVTMDGSPSSDKIDATCFVNDSALPIDLLSPNPLTNPSLNDNSKQYVYSANYPDGYLYVPGSLQVVGGTNSDALFLLGNYPLWSPNDQVDMRIENPVIPNTLMHQWAVGNGTISVNTPNNDYPGYQSNTWIYKGLPPQNDNFGSHQANLYVEGNLSQTANILTYFNGTASNWPGSDGSSWPNWYYYYQQVYWPFSSDLVQYEPISHTPENCSYTSGTSPFTVTLSDDAYNTGNGGSTILVFDIQPNAPKYIRCIGELWMPNRYSV